jgi:hypothetical protein
MFGFVGIAHIELVVAVFFRQDQDSWKKLALRKRYLIRRDLLDDSVLL